MPVNRDSIGPDPRELAFHLLTNSLFHRRFDDARNAPIQRQQKRIAILRARCTELFYQKTPSSSPHRKRGVALGVAPR